MHGVKSQNDRDFEWKFNVFHVLSYIILGSILIYFRLLLFLHSDLSATDSQTKFLYKLLISLTPDACSARPLIIEYIERYGNCDFQQFSLNLPLKKSRKPQSLEPNSKQRTELGMPYKQALVLANVLRLSAAFCLVAAFLVMGVEI